jgi:hypothetical protein
MPQSNARPDAREDSINSAMAGMFFAGRLKVNLRKNSQSTARRPDGGGQRLHRFVATAVNTSWLVSGNVVARRPASLVESRVPGSEGFGMVYPVKRPANRRYTNHKRLTL